MLACNRIKNVGAGLLAKRSVHPTQILRVNYRFREQARSHKGVISVLNTRSNATPVTLATHHP
ncbi:hypothetical protein D3C78_1869830 [compost metagenome]